MNEQCYGQIELFKNNTEIVELDIYKSGVFLGCRYGMPALYVWGLGVLASGEGSTMMGCYTGQLTMEGFLHLKWVRWKRVLLTRSIAIMPTFLVAFYSTLPQLSGLNDLLNAMFSVQIPFAVLPLVAFTSNHKLMGQFANGLTTKIVIALVSASMIVINVYFVWASVATQLIDYRLLTVLLLYAILYISMCIYLVTHMLASMNTDHPLSQRILRRTSWRNKELDCWKHSYRPILKK